MALTIPRMFTTRFIRDEIAKLTDSISANKKELEGLPFIIAAHRKTMADVERLKQEDHSEARASSFRAGLDGYLLPSHYSQQADYSRRIRDASNEIIKIEDKEKALRQQIFGYETKKRKFEALLLKTEEQRTEEYYQQLLGEKDGASTDKEFSALGIKFHEMETYKDAEVLENECYRLAAKKGYDDILQRKKTLDLDILTSGDAYTHLTTDKKYVLLAQNIALLRENNIVYLTQELELLTVDCEDAAREARYRQLVREKNKASTERDLQDIGKQLEKEDGYKDTAELAKDCYARILVIRERKEEQVRSTQYRQLVRTMKRASTEKEFQELAEQFQEMPGYEDAMVLAGECDRKYRELKKRRVELEFIRDEEERRRRANEERKRLFWKACIYVLGGTIGGVAFAIATDGDGSQGGNIFGYAVCFGIASFIVGYCKDRWEGACIWGCGGSIVGAIIGAFFGGLSSMVFNVFVGIIVGVVTVVLIKKYR